MTYPAPELPPWPKPIGTDPNKVTDKLAHTLKLELATDIDMLRHKEDLLVELINSHEQQLTDIIAKVQVVEHLTGEDVLFRHVFPGDR